MRKFLVKVNGNQYEVDVEEIVNANSTVKPVAENKTAPSVSIPAAAVQKKETSAAVPQNKDTVPKPDETPKGAMAVKAPMPGTILKVNVSKGDAVKKGQVLLILEAMKMENEIVSPVNGMIASAGVIKGSSVNAGDILLSIA